MRAIHLIILCSLLSLGNTLPLQASSESKRIPWMKPVLPSSSTLRPPPSASEKKVLPTPAQLETREFNQAFEQLKAAKYSVAAEGFKQFIQRYPRSERRGEAHYWIGEAHYLAKDYPQALAQFSHIIIYFADSEFARQAMLKSADTYRAMQNIPQAKLFYQRVIKNHPDTSYAVKAAGRLRQLQKNNDA